MNVTCSLCHIKFSNPKKLKGHMIKIHKIYPESHSFDENEKLFKCQECGSSYKLSQDLIYHLETTHNIPIEREEITFENVTEFNKWKHHIEKVESCTYIPLDRRIKTDEGPRVKKYICTPPTHKKYYQESSKLRWSCISIIKTVEAPSGDLYVARVKTHYGHDSNTHIKKLKHEKQETYKLKNETIASDEATDSESMDKDESEEELYGHTQNVANLKEDIKDKFDAVLSSLDKFDNKKLKRINSVLNNICEELDLVTTSTNNEVIGTIIISCNSNLDHSYI